ncbi:hypothetical protein [Sphingobium yanoikuyae]|uniref:hypothetical protein n=1 Tax=Sphingobium yanoikuyae TaxID=13690 RepID=UPI0026F18E46|nr:hypothetical protein [Sphingobium yanoikuyae]
MADISDIDMRVAEMRAWILADNGVAASIRTFDANAELMVHLINEMREVNANLRELIDQGNRRI